MGGLFRPIDEPDPKKPSKKSGGRHPQAKPDYRVKGRKGEHGRKGGWDYTIEKRGLLDVLFGTKR